MLKRQLYLSQAEVFDSPPVTKRQLVMKTYIMCEIDRRGSQRNADGTGGKWGDGGRSGRRVGEEWEREREREREREKEE